MAAILDTIRPGDVISSDLINRIIGLLNEHDALIAGGGGGSSSASIITGFDPPTQQNVGRQLRLFGNFDFPLGSNSVWIDGIPILPPFEPGSNNSQLVVIVPNSISVPGASRSVTVRVQTSQGTDDETYTLLPPVPGLPDPVINAAVDDGSSSPVIRSERDARITGVNFIAPAGNNRVRLIFNPGGGQTAFPPGTNDSLVIDVPASTINPAPAESTLIVMMPAIGPALIPAVGGTSPAVLEVTVPGANNPDTLSVTIRRMA